MRRRRNDAGGRHGLVLGQAGPDGADLGARAAVAALIGVDGVTVGALADRLLRALGQARAADDALLGDPVAHTSSSRFETAGMYTGPPECVKKGLLYRLDTALAAVGSFWQAGQRCVPRPPTRMCSMGFPQVVQGSPRRW